MVIFSLPGNSGCVDVCFRMCARAAPEPRQKRQKRTRPAPVLCLNDL